MDSRRGAFSIGPSTGGTHHRATVYVVEDDRDLRDLLAAMVRGTGFDAVACRSGAHALETIVPTRAGCVVMDLQLPDMDALELRRRLVQRACRHPFIVVTGSSDVSLAVRSMRDGAVDYMQKPFSMPRLLECIRGAVERDIEQRRFQSRLDALTDREREILRLVIAGQATKEIARRLDISPRTVDVHRHHVLKKMNAQSLVQLVGQLAMHEIPAANASPPAQAPGTAGAPARGATRSPW